MSWGEKKHYWPESKLFKIEIFQEFAVIKFKVISMGRSGQDEGRNKIDRRGEVKELRGQTWKPLPMWILNSLRSTRGVELERVGLT